MSRIVIAHHQSHAVRVFSHLLSQRGHSVTVCTTGDEVEGAVRRGHHELILLDVKLSDTDALALLRTLRSHANGARAVIIALTSDASEQDFADIIAAGADDYMDFPMTLEMIQVRLDVALRRLAQPQHPAPQIDIAVRPATTDALTALPVPGFTLISGGKVTGANKPLARLTGYSIDELIGAQADDVGLAAALVALAEFEDRGLDELQTDAVVFVTRDGRPLRVDLHLSPADHTSGGETLVVVHRHQPTLPDPPPAIAPSLQASDDLSLVFDRRGLVRMVTGALAGELGYEPFDLGGRDISSLVHPDDLSFLRVVAPGKAPDRDRVNVRFSHRDGSWVRLAVSARDLSDPHGTEAFLLVGHKRERAETSASESRHSGIDRLTGLPDRDAFLRELHDAFMVAGREQRRIAVFYINLDRFRTVNESFGYEAGDVLLREVGDRLRDHIGPLDELARIGGDEFALLVVGRVGAAAMGTIAEKIVQDFRLRPFIIEGQPVFITPSIGIALSTPAMRNSKELLRNADTALVHARDRGHARYAVFEPRMVARSQERLALEADLQRALAKQELRVYYQPEVDLRDGRIVGSEALVRWEHPRKGLILPGEFIETAELTGLIESMGLWVLEQACRQVAAWQHRYRLGPGFCVGVNFSADHFKRPTMVNDVVGVLRRTALDPANLRIEITESALVEKEPAVVQTLHRLKKLGVQLAIDDFGTGYSSLSYLRTVPADTLKIDRSFVSGKSTASGLLTITQSVVSMAHSSGLAVVVEGIETARQLERVTSFACERGQGYYFSRPVATDTMEFLLSAGPYPFASIVRGEQSQSSDNARALVT